MYSKYRTGIYYKNQADVEIIKEVIEEEQKKYDALIVVEVEPLSNFYEAEEYHQNYLEKNPNGYCHVDFSTLKDPNSISIDSTSLRFIPVEKMEEENYAQFKPLVK